MTSTKPRSEPDPSRPAGRLVTGRSLPPTWVWEAGEPGGAPPLVLLHGWMATAALNWQGSLRYLGQRFRVVAPNLRGHGRHGRGSPPFSVEGCADDLAALIGELGLDKPVAVGYSMGGAIAQVLARRHGDLLAGIALCATAASFARRISLRPAVRLVGGFSSAAARAWPEPAAAFLRWRVLRHDQALAKKGASHQADAEALEERFESHLAAFIEAGAELNAYDSRDWLPRLDIPAAVLVTSRDEVVAPWRQRAMASLLRGAETYEVDAGHDAVVARPEVFLPVLAEACRRLAARRQRSAAVTAPAASTTEAE